MCRKPAATIHHRCRPVQHGQSLIGSEYAHHRNAVATAHRRAAVQQRREARRRRSPDGTPRAESDDDSSEGGDGSEGCGVRLPSLHDLPLEVIETVFEHLGPVELGRCACVSRWGPAWLHRFWSGELRGTRGGGGRPGWRALISVSYALLGRACVAWDVLVSPYGMCKSYVRYRFAMPRYHRSWREVAVSSHMDMVWTQLFHLTFPRSALVAAAGPGGAGAPLATAYTLFCRAALGKSWAAAGTGLPPCNEATCMYGQDT